jgi:carboxyl-terminal processing protease
MNKLLQTILAGVAPALMAVWTTTARGEAADRGAAFQQVYDLVRSNAVGVTAAGLDRAALQGILDQYPSVVTLGTNALRGVKTQLAPLAERKLFDGGYAYLRVSRVATGLGDQLRSAYERLSATNDLKGVVLDLRYAGGDDYEAAARAADQFLTTAQPLLSWGDQSARSTAKSGAITNPLMVLVNRDTSGAAEALAAVLRNTEAGLVIGSPTAGQAYVFQDFPLRNGGQLRIATGAVRVGPHHLRLSAGVSPDIQVKVKPADEAAYYADPYKVLKPPVPVLFASSPTNSTLGLSPTNTEPVHRLTEADLVRQQEDRLSAPQTEAPPAPAPAAKPVVQDPALARALDLLKGLAVVQRQLRHP